MSKFWIDYSTAVLIEADSAEEAEKFFWNGGSDIICRSEVRIDGIEEEED